MHVMFMVHHEADNVGVAVVDIAAGARATGRFKDREGVVELSTVTDVPLGHKLALCDLAEGAEVIEYGVAVGRTTKAIDRGAMTHTHNMKGQRWA